MRPQARQARQLVLELRELDLEPALVGLGVEGEDVEDQPAAVDDLDVEQALEALLLGRAELVVGDQDVEAGLGLCAWSQLLGLALAHVPVGVDVAAVLPLGAHDVGARRGRQGGELGQAVVGGPALVVAGVDGDEERLLDGRGEVDGLVAGLMALRGYPVARRRQRPCASTNAASAREVPRGCGIARSASMTARPGSRRNQVALALARTGDVAPRVERRSPPPERQLAVEHAQLSR